MSITKAFGITGAILLCARPAAAGITERVSVSSSEAQANGQSLKPAISRDGRFVAFASPCPRRQLRFFRRPPS
jgi:hypothetical protein